jgi:hypothetical protein
VFEMILVPGNCTGNVSFENEIASSFPILCKLKLSVIVKIKYLKPLATVSESFTFP